MTDMHKYISVTIYVSIYININIYIYIYIYILYIYIYIYSFVEDFFLRFWLKNLHTYCCVFESKKIIKIVIKSNQTMPNKSLT